MSPTSSVGPGTPRVISPVSASAERTTPLSGSAISLTSPIVIDTLATSPAPTPSKDDSPTRRKSKVQDLKNLFDRKKQTIPVGDGTEDQDVPVTCSIFPSPFRRECTALPSPVKEKVSIFEGLVKPIDPSPASPMDAGAVNVQEQSDSQPLLAGTELLEGKRKSLDWLTRPFRKMSMHRGKDTPSSKTAADGKITIINEHTLHQQSMVLGPPFEEDALNNQGPAQHADPALAHT